MSQLTITVDEMANDIVMDHIKMLCQKAYEQGVEDGMKRLAFPPVLNNRHLEEIFQIKSASVTKITGMPTFPRLKHIQARYPRDQVFRWIEENSTWVQGNTNYFGKEAM